jgi:hypothetical protein
MALLAMEGRVRGTNHLLHLDEVMAGANGNSKIQFIVVSQEAFGQNLWGPQFGETQSRAMLVFFDATGRETGKFKFPGDPPTGGTLKTLIATLEFASLPGAPAPDIIIPPLLSPISGKVCFKSNPLNTVFLRNECLSYGGADFTGATESSEIGVPFGPPAAALSIVNTVSLRRTTDTDTNADFSLTTTPTPRNIAGATLTIPVATPIAQGENLFKNEAFLGNGRTCASCHVAGQSFRLPPANIQSRFATLSSTFDPQFIGENAPSSFDGGFDFNLNTLVLTAAVATNAPCTGDLRGIITGTTGRAKVLTRIAQPVGDVSPPQYLVYGGRSPVLTGIVTDGVCSATVASITAGSLAAIPGSGVAGLEDPKRMRTSGSPDFPQGRALILENIDGFPPTAPVFRKSPHLLNLSRTAPFGFNGDIPDLQTFATGAVQQHFPRTLTRNSSGSNPDFRVPTGAERAAMEAFMLAQEFPSGSDPDKFNLDRFATTAAQIRGQTAFFGSAKCSQCHGGPVLATTTVNILGKGIGVNAAFNTGVVNQSINSPAGDNLPAELGGAREFSVPQLFNVKNLGPFFHDSSVATVRQAVEFYTSTTFNNSPAGLAIGGITLSAQDADDITAFLEALVVIVPATISANSTTSLSGPAGSVVSPAPSVIVLDGDGSPAAGTLVTFAITGGSGSLTGATPVTNASGVATMGSWTIGPGENTLTASVTGLTGSPVLFTAVGTTNDSFVNRFTLTGGSVTTTGSNIGASAELGEPSDLLNGGSGTPSVWWTWTAPCSFTVTQPTSFIDTTGSGFDTVLGVFTGSSLAALTRFASDDDAGGSLTSRVPSLAPGPATLNIAAGTVFQIRVRSSGSTPGNITLHINGPAPPICGGNTAPTISTIANQPINEDTATGALPFTVLDLETAAASLTLSGSSSNPTLVPNANITFGGGGASRTVTVMPAANQFGTTTITVTVSDGSLSTSTSFVVTVTAVNDAPTVTSIANQTTNEHTATGAIAFTVGDVETAAASLTVSGSSSNTTLVPAAEILFGGSGASRTVTLTPVSNQLGDATITVTVSDGSLSTSTSFLLTVTAVNHEPTITSIANQTTNEDIATGPIAFTVGDMETAVASLTVSGSSSNTQLVPNANITLGGSGANRTVTLRPAAHRAGGATITVVVSDGSLTTSTSFVLTVLPLPDDVALDFGAAGLWGFENGVFAQLHSLNPGKMAIGDLDGNGKADLIVDFPGHGVWVRSNNASWVQLHTSNAAAIVTGDLDGNGRADVLVDFPGFGLWVYMNNSNWSRLHPVSPTKLATGDLDGNGKDEVIIDFAGSGVWVWANNTAFSQLHTANAAAIVTGDLDGNGKAEVLLDFPGAGLWVWANNVAWSQLHTVDATVMATGDLDGNGKADAIISFPGFGTWAWMNNAGFARLHASNAALMTTGDLDGTGKSDVIISFPGAGMWAWMNNSRWIQLHTQNPEAMTAGNFDGR